MSLDTTIVGDPSAVRAVAEWLDPDLRNAGVEVDLESAYVASDSSASWRGESGAAYRDVIATIRGNSSELYSFVGDVAEVFRAYAGRLERGRDTFEGYRDRARGNGLMVSGQVILPPTTTLGYCPTSDAPEKDVAEWNAFQSRVDVYTSLVDSVGRWWGELQSWIAENLAPLAGKVAEFSELARVADALHSANEAVVGIAFEHADARADRDLSDWRAEAKTMQDSADTFQDQLRSGNPALRAAAEAADPREMRAVVGTMNELIADAAKYTKVIPVAGAVVEIVAAGSAIAGGDSPSSVVVGLGGSAAGGWIAGALITGVTLPPVGVALLVGGAAVAVGFGATWLYEAWVPLDVREAIDAGLSEPILISEPTDTWAVGTR